MKEERWKKKEHKCGVGMRIPAELKNAIMKLADTHKTSFTNVIETILYSDKEISNIINKI